MYDRNLCFKRIYLFLATFTAQNISTLPAVMLTSQLIELVVAHHACTGFIVTYPSVKYKKIQFTFTHTLVKEQNQEAQKGLAYDTVHLSTISKCAMSKSFFTVQLNFCKMKFCPPCIQIWVDLAEKQQHL